MLGIGASSARMLQQPTPCPSQEVIPVTQSPLQFLPRTTQHGQIYAVPCDIRKGLPPSTVATIICVQVPAASPPPCPLATWLTYLLQLLHHHVLYLTLSKFRRRKSQSRSCLTSEQAASFFVFITISSPDAFFFKAFLFCPPEVLL